MYRAEVSQEAKRSSVARWGQNRVAIGRVQKKVASVSKTVTNLASHKKTQNSPDVLPLLRLQRS